MSVTLTLDGMDALREGLRTLPEDLAAQAALVVRATAQQVGQEVIANYPSRTGNLKRGVSVIVSGSRVSTSGLVRSAAPHASLFEYGTSRRQTRSGANRGVMPKGPTDELVGPRASRARKRMVEQLIDVVKASGSFEVTES